MRTVLVYRSELLPYSETFIKEQILAYKAWRGILVGRTLLHQLDLNGLELRVLKSEEQGILGRIIAKVRHDIGGAPQFGILQRNWLDVLRQEKPSLLHAHFGVDAFVAEPIARAIDVPMIVTLHGYDINIHRNWWEAGYGGRHMQSYPLRLTQLAKARQVHFVAVSDAIRAQAIAYGIDAAKITTCYFGVDLTKFSPGPIPIGQRPPRILFVGRLVEKKGCEYLIRALAQVVKIIPKAELVIVGDGPRWQSLDQLATELGVHGCVQFRGNLPHREIKAEMHQARVLCSPSVRAGNGDAEGLPTVILEAQACGLPVVTSANGGRDEGIANGITGLAFAEGDVDGLASNLVRLLTDGELTMEMSKAAPRFVAEKFDIRHCTEGLERLYDSLCLSVE